MSNDKSLTTVLSPWRLLKFRADNIDGLMVFQSEFELHARAILGLPVNTDLRLFGKPESYSKRLMGVALAFDADVTVARTNAKLAASKVKPRAV